MYLMDGLTDAAAEVTRNGARNVPVLEVFPMIADRLVGAPRYLFDDAATRTAVELTLGRPKVLREAIGNCRIPYPKLWVEWEEGARTRLREIFGERSDPHRPLPTRVGFLVECDANGRQGVVTWVWSAKVGGGLPFPNIGPISGYFDLDRQFPQAANRTEALMGGNLANYWKGNPVQVQALCSIWETADHRPNDDWGPNFLAAIGRERLPTTLAHAYADVYGEYIMMWAAIMLLTASRPIVTYTPIDLSRLNRARKKRGQPLRLDHTQVTMRLQQRPTDQVVRGPLGYSRKSPRVHLVSSYLARRGTAHWIVQPYWRGQGETISRRVQVRG